MGPIRKDGGPTAVSADHLILVRFPTGGIQLRESGPGRAMPDGSVEWRDLGHISEVFPGANPFDCWGAWENDGRGIRKGLEADQAASPNTITIMVRTEPGSFVRRVQEDPQIAVNLLNCLEKSADQFHDTGVTFLMLGHRKAAEAMAIAETATREVIAQAKGGA